MMKKVIVGFLALLLLAALPISLASCARAPRVEEIYDRVVELIDASYEVNTVFYGDGLPVWKTDSEFAEFTHLYFDFPYKGDYEQVKHQASFSSIEDIKRAAAQVYSRDYLENVLFPAAFDGLAVGDLVEGARYLEEKGILYQSTHDSFDIKGVPIYDYSTMKVSPVGKRGTCIVEMEYFLDVSPDVRATAALRLSLDEDGQWYLASFTG
jgi:hypothetical protein